MYDIRPESIKTFITDRSVKLPRFQRKQTWNEEKNFQLCISLFKEYPIGVCILSVDEEKGKPVKWLLDGRQRKNALQMMYEDPENIYNWAKKFIKFKNSDQPNEIEEQFKTRISEYIEADIEEEETAEIIIEDDTSAVEGDLDLDDEGQDVYGLDLLLRIITITHNKTRKATGFTRPFDFSDCVDRLPYIINNNGYEQLSSRKVKTFIDEYQRFCDDSDLNSDEKQSFLSFLDSRAIVKNEEKLKNELNANWNAIKERMLIVEKIDLLLSNGKIGMIEVKALSPADSQKIFNIINSEGEKLTAVEILSAKPHWNLPVDNPSQTTVDAVQQLYQRIGAQQDGVVRWDMPATLIKRLGENFVIKQLSDSNTDFEKELTLGFKLLSGYYVEGIKKEHIERLGKVNTINWSTDVDQFVADLQNMLRLIGGLNYFKFFKSWRTTIMEISSDAIALNFLLVAYKDWVKKGKPVGDSASKVFQKDCFILWDKMIFEYLNKQWRGAADQKITNNLKLVDSDNTLFEPIAKDRWLDLIGLIKTTSAIEDVDVSQSLMKPLLYHTYCLLCISGPDTDYDIEVDHIIPQTLFNESSLPRASAIQHNVLNLGLLPKNENSSKGRKRLNELLHDDWMINQIEKYDFIPKDDFVKFSNVNNYKELFDLREKRLIEAFTTKRDNVLNN